MRPRCPARSTAIALVALSLVQSATSAFAHDTPEPAEAPVEEFVVFGRTETELGRRTAGSEGHIDHEAIRLRPIGRVGELLETIPGLIATQHSGTGKANQLFLRGFNLDHGTDFATFFDGVPVNLRSHGHGQGYTDLNFVIPELVESIDFRKGPYRADVGDFSSAGASFMKTYDRLPESFALATYGQYGYVRGLAATGIETETGDGLFALEGRTNQGPYDLDAHLLHLNGLAKWTQPLASGTLRASASAYHGSWNSTDQIPKRATGNGIPGLSVPRLGFIDPDLGGRTTRAIASLAWEEEDEAPLSLSTYFLFYDFDLFSNFTYFLTNPENDATLPGTGDELEQRDRRIAWGANGEQRFDASLAGESVEIRTGFETRLDRIFDLGLFNTEARRIRTTIRQDEVTEWSGSVFAEARQEPFDWLTVVAGLRGDVFAFDVDTHGGIGAGANGGSRFDGLVNPKLAIVAKPHAHVELYLNGGGGFHSNDARGTTTRIDPSLDGGGAAISPVDPLSRQWGGESGVRWQPNHHFHTTAVAWYLVSDSELVFVGDAGTTEPRGGSERFGVEWTAFVRPVWWLALDATYSWSNGRFLHQVEGRDRIPGALEHVVSAGATVTAGGFSTSLRLRHFGAYPLVEDDTQRAASTTLVNLGTAYTWRWLTGELTVVNLFDSKDSDIQYFYTSRLPGEPAGGVDDTHFHPVEPRQLRGTLKIAF